MATINFKTLENAQNIEKIAKIFGKNKPNYELKPRPYLVILVGSPGVGKTTKAKEILKAHIGLKYDDFYNISLDSLVERVRPYRSVTKQLHNTLKNKRRELGSNKLINKNFSLLSEAYLPTIMSKKSNFTLKNTLESKQKKIALLGTNEKLPLAPRKKTEESELQSLNELREEGFKYGVLNGLNIIYDTTLTKNKDKIKENLMPILELNKEVKYKIVVILVTAPEETVKQRIRGRHNAMLLENDPYIRAVSLNLVSKFIEDNKEGFNIAEEYFTRNHYYSNNPNTIYTSDDFTFIEIENLNKKLKTN